MNKKVIKSKSGIIVKCPQVSTGVVKIILKSSVDLDLYYTSKSNVDHLKETGSFKDGSGVIYKEKGKHIEGFIKIISGESYFVIVNDTEHDSEYSIELKIAFYSSTGVSGTSGSTDTSASTIMTGLGTSTSSGFSSGFK